MRSTKLSEGNVEMTKFSRKTFPQTWSSNCEWSIAKTSAGSLDDALQGVWRSYSWRLPAAVTSWQPSARYCGARPLCSALKTNTASWNSTPWRTGSQRSWRRTGVMSQRDVPAISHDVNKRKFLRPRQIFWSQTGLVLRPTVSDHSRMTVVRRAAAFWTACSRRIRPPAIPNPWCKQDQILNTKTRTKTSGSKQRHFVDLTFK